MLRRNGMSALADLQGMARGDRLAVLSPVQGVALRAVRDHRAVTSVKDERPQDGLRCGARPDQRPSVTGALAGVPGGQTAKYWIGIAHTISGTA